ncbi:MAG: zinc ribbon domain-containing protein, partial [Anaeroplasmataceae bacterium]|nr:zinc ribbon domain-containing protein [Anaeroplasmataceae bacterium]
ILFLFLPILVLFLIVKSKKSKELNNLTHCFKNFLFAEGIISVLMFFLGFAGLAMSSQIWLSITACVMCIILIPLLIFERIKCFRKLVGRMVVIMIAVICYAITFILDDTWADIIESLCCISLLFSVILYIIILVSLVKLKDIIEEEQAVNKKNRYYPVSYLSLGWLVAIYVNASIVVSFIIAAIILYANGLSSIGGMLCICGGIVSLMFIFVLAILMGISNNKPFKVYAKDLDFDKLEQTILERLKNPKINPETINFFKLRLANASIGHSVKRYFELMEEVVMPKNKLYKTYYDLSLIHCLLPYEEIKKKCEMILVKYPKKLVIKKSVPIFLKRQQAMETGFVDEDIKKIAPYDTKNKYLNAYNLFIQIHYYMKQENELESENLKKLFIQNYSSLQTLVDDLNGISMKEKYKELEQENPIIRCPQCAYPMKSTMKFCSNCGKKLKEDDEPCHPQENI